MGVGVGEAHLVGDDTGTAIQRRLFADELTRSGVADLDRLVATVHRHENTRRRMTARD